MSKGSTPLPGQSVGRYRVVRQLGAGGMAEVFLAHDPQLNRDVAIKVLGEQLIDRPGYRAFLAREARAIARLSHPHIAQVFDVLEFQGRTCFVMEYLKGETLAERIARGPLAVADVLTLGAQLAGAVAHAHAQGVLHCDLKPRNVFLVEGTTTKVLDFGLAQPLGAMLEGPAAEIGASPSLVANRAGTPEYMSPEQFWGRPLDARADIYSLGVMVSEMATGRRPASRPAAIAPAAAGDTTREVVVVDPQVPPPLQPVVRRALALDPEKRYQSALELQDALESLAARSPVEWAVHAPVPVPATTEPATAGRARAVRIARAFAWVLGAAAGITLLGLVNTTAFNLALGRERFASETAFDWFVWGARSLVAPGVLALAALVLLEIVQPVVRFVWGRGFPRLSTRVSTIVHDSGFDRPERASRLFAACGLAALVALYLRFADLIAAFAADISTSAPEEYALLGEAHFLEHRYYRVSLSVLTLLIVLALRVLVRQRRRAPGRSEPGPFVAVSAVLAFTLLLLDVPYRILYQGNRFEKARLGGDTCYLVGDNADHLLLHCPNAPVPRNRTIRRDDARLERLGCFGSVFDRSTACEPLD